MGHFDWTLHDGSGEVVIRDGVAIKPIPKDSLLYYRVPGVPDLPPITDPLANLKRGLGTFGDALVALKAGERVQRSGWNGKGMWLALTPGSIITLDKARSGAAEHLAGELLTQDALSSHPRPQDRSMTIGAHIDMRAADGSLVIGWLASQTDMLAADWRVL